MFRLILCTILLQYSVGVIIRGRILLDGNDKLSTAVPSTSILFVRFRDASIPHLMNRNLVEINVTNLNNFPFKYEMNITNELNRIFFYTLSARILNGSNLLYTSSQAVRVPIGDPGPINLDIPMAYVNTEIPTSRHQISRSTLKKMSWPEMIGKNGEEAAAYIKSVSGLTRVFIVPANSFMTMDYRLDRVRIFVDKNGIVVRAPTTA